LPGLVWAWRFGPTGAPAPLAPDQPIDLDAAPSDWFWLHFDLLDMRAHGWLTHAPYLPDSARLMLLSAQEHPALQAKDGVLAGALPDIVREMDDRSEQSSHLRFVLTHNALVTGGRHVLQATLELQKAIEQGQAMAAPGALLQSIVDQIAADIGGRLHILSDGFDKIVDRLLVENTAIDNLGLARQRRHLVRVHRRLAGLCALLERTDPASGLEQAVARQRIDIQHCLHRFSSLDHEAMAMLERGRLLQDEIATRLATETNRHLHALSILTALLLPPSLVFGIFGMNVGGLPLGQTHFGIVITLALAAISAGLAFGSLRRLTRFLKRRGVVK
jgi:zinc transporter